MEATVNTPAPSERIAFGRLWWVGLLAAATAIVANALLRAVAMAFFDIPAGFEALALEEVVLSTAIGVAGATVVFAIVGRFLRHPVRIFQIIAGVALLLSFVPPFSVAESNVRILVTLNLMHVVAAVISVGFLTTLARRK